MFGEVNWATVILSLIGSFIGAGSVITSLLIAYGKFYGQVTEQIKQHESRLKESNGKISAQQAKDFDLSSTVKEISMKCAERYNLFVKNDREHSEIFKRVNVLETTVASVSGKINEAMDKRMSQLRADIKSDVQLMFSSRNKKE